MPKPHIQVDAFPLVDHHFSGVGHYTLGIVRGFDELAAEGKLSYSFVAHRRMSGGLEKFGFKHHTRVVRNPLPNRFLDLLMQRGWTAPVDLVVGRGAFYFPSFAAWPTWFSRAGVVVHDVTYLAVPECVEDRNRKFLTAIVPHSIRNAKNIITVSEFSKTEIVKYYGVDKESITVARPSVDTAFFYKRTPDEIAKVKEKYRIDAEHYILSVGNIEPRKNYERLLEAFSAMPPDVVAGTALVIVGAGGWKDEHIRAAIAKAEQRGLRVIKPQQYVADEDMPALYSGARFFVFVPLYEGFGMPPLEAMACGTPSLVSNVASLPEAAGRAAVYVDPYDVDDIGRGLLDMARMDASARSKVDALMREHLQSFSWRASAEITAACLTGLPASHFAR